MPLSMLGMQLCAAGLLVFGYGSLVHGACTETVPGTLTCTGNQTVYGTNFSGYDYVEITLSGPYNLSGPQGIGYYANGGSTAIDVERISISTNGASADAIRTNGNATLSIAGELIINARGSSGDGINASNANGSGAWINILGENAYIESNGGVGVRANITSNTRGNEISIAKNAVILTKGDGSNFGESTGYGVYAGNRDRDTANLPQTGTARVSIGDGSEIHTFGKNAYAVYANKTGQIQLGSTTIITEGQGAHGIVAMDGKVARCTGTYASLCLLGLDIGLAGEQSYTGGQVYLTGDTAITVNGAGSDAIYASGTGSLVISGARDGTPASGRYTVKGDLVADRQGQIKLTANDGSAFDSNIRVTGDSADPAASDATRVQLDASGTRLTGNIQVQHNGTAAVAMNSQSQMTGDIAASGYGSAAISADQSAVAGNVLAYDNGRVAFDLRNGAVFDGMVDADDTAGNGTSGGTVALEVDASTWNMTADSYVTTLELSNAGTVALGPPTFIGNSAVLTVDDLGGTGGTFVMRTDMANQAGDRIVIRKTSSGAHALHFNDSRSGGYTGAEELEVVEFTGQDAAANQALFTSAGADVGAYVYGLTQKTDGNWWLVRADTPTPDPDPDPTPPINNVGTLSAGMLNLNYLMGYVENQTLLQRMGELRRAPQARGDVWVHAFAGQLDKFDGPRLTGFDMDYSGVQIGVDRQITSQDLAGKLYAGVMGGYGRGDGQYRAGSASVDSYHVGIYGTFESDDGWYVDGIAKYVRMNNALNTVTTNGYVVKGDTATDGFAVGLESGKRFYLQAPQKGWYLEPQAQLTYSRQSGATVRADTGLRTELGAYDSTIGRLSVIAGYSVVEGANPVDVYVKTGYVREFSGNTHYTFNQTDREDYDFGGGWWDNGIGVNMQINRRHHLYLDATYAKGGSFDQKQINAGYRYTF
uniref:autotransporter outer membrane beta-barrel domain-containing protein n=1 Tax=Castellaniella defragrans TaxID=75697 RepID=UPI0033424ECE